MLERALRLKHNVLLPRAEPKGGQKAYNAREGIETRLWYNGCGGEMFLGQKAYNAREGIETHQMTDLMVQHSYRHVRKHIMLERALRQKVE